MSIFTNIKYRILKNKLLKRIEILKALLSNNRNKETIIANLKKIKDLMSNIDTSRVKYLLTYRTVDLIDNCIRHISTNNLDDQEIYMISLVLKNIIDIIHKSEKIEILENLGLDLYEYEKDPIFLLFLERNMEDVYTIAGYTKDKFKYTIKTILYIIDYGGYDISFSSMKNYEPFKLHLDYWTSIMSIVQVCKHNSYDIIELLRREIGINENIGFHKICYTIIQLYKEFGSEIMNMMQDGPKFFMFEETISDNAWEYFIEEMIKGIKEYLSNYPGKSINIRTINIRSILNILEKKRHLFVKNTRLSVYLACAYGSTIDELYNKIVISDEISDKYLHIISIFLKKPEKVYSIYWGNLYELEDMYIECKKHSIAENVLKHLADLCSSPSVTKEKLIIAIYLVRYFWDVISGDLERIFIELRQSYIGSDSSCCTILRDLDRNIFLKISEKYGYAGLFKLISEYSKGNILLGKLSFENIFSNNNLYDHSIPQIIRYLYRLKIDKSGLEIMNIYKKMNQNYDALELAYQLSSSNQDTTQLEEVIKKMRDSGLLTKSILDSIISIAKKGYKSHNINIFINTALREIQDLNIPNNAQEILSDIFNIVAVTNVSIKNIPSLYVSYIKSEMQINNFQYTSKFVSMFFNAYKKSRIENNIEVDDLVEIKSDEYASKIFRVYSITLKGAFIIYLDTGRIVGPVDTELLKKFEEKYDIYSIRELTKKGFLILHSTNAFKGGTAKYSEIDYRDPITLIEKNIENEGKYVISCHTIHPSYHPSVLINAEEYDYIKGRTVKFSVGMILSDGKILSAYVKDANTRNITDKAGKKIDTYRKSEETKVNIARALTAPDYYYNEIIPINWKVTGLYYTKDTPRKYISQIVNNAGKYKKDVYFINEETNTWRVFKQQDLIDLEKWLENSNKKIDFTPTTLHPEGTLNPNEQYSTDINNSGNTILFIQNEEGKIFVKTDRPDAFFYHNYWKGRYYSPMENLLKMIRKEIPDVKWESLKINKLPYLLGIPVYHKYYVFIAYCSAESIKGDWVDASQVYKGSESEKVLKSFQKNYPGILRIAKESKNTKRIKKSAV